MPKIKSDLSPSPAHLLLSLLERLKSRESAESSIWRKAAREALVTIQSIMEDRLRVFGKTADSLKEIEARAGKTRSDLERLQSKKDKTREDYVSIAGISAELADLESRVEQSQKTAEEAQEVISMEIDEFQSNLKNILITFTQAGLLRGAREALAPFYEGGDVPDQELFKLPAIGAAFGRHNLRISRATPGDAQCRQVINAIGIALKGAA